MSGQVRVLLAALLAAAAIAAADEAAAASIRLINRDAPGEGFNDPTPAPPVGGNGGTTLGEQRLIAFQHAIDIWAARVQSPVEIRVAATFDPLQCDAGSVTLGLAGPVSAFSDFAGAPEPAVLYPGPLADRLAGVDLAPEEDDIEAQFNSRFGTNCAFPAGWYYGLDGQPPGDDSDFVTVVLHELGHGLGFISFVDVISGALLDNTKDVMLGVLVDDRSGKSLAQMSNAERRSAIRSLTHLKWEGAEVVAASAGLLGGVDQEGRVEMFAPSPPVEASSVSHWSDAVFPNQLMEPFFTAAIHDIGLAGPALADLGWVGPACGSADCNADGQVMVDELVTAVRVALGEAALTTCSTADVDGDGTVTVNELVRAVRQALDGC